MAITRLTRRHLTVLSDVLNAFVDIASVIKQQEAIPHSANIASTQDLAIEPLHFTNEGDLPQMRSWDWEETMAKRPGVKYPSWHWSHWLGAINFPYETHGTMIESPYVYHPSEGLRRSCAYYQDDIDINDVHPQRLQYLATQVPWTLLMRCDYLAQEIFILEKLKSRLSESWACMRYNHYPFASQQTARVKIYMKWMTPTTLMTTFSRETYTS